MDRLKVAALGLKSGGSELSRRLSGKMKELLQPQTQESKMVEEATSDRFEEPNWGLNLRICGLLNRDEFSGTEVMRAVKKRMGGKSAVSQRLSLDLLEACAMNCDKVFSEVASEKVLDEMVRMIESAETEDGNRRRAWELIEAWGKSEDLDYLPVFKQTYKSLKARKALSGVPDGESSSIEPGVDDHLASLPQMYPYPGMDQTDTDSDLLNYHEAVLSMDEKKEILVITRNSIEILSSILNSETQEKSSKDDLMMGMVERCKSAQYTIQRIIQSTTDDEPMLFEALNIHDELEQVLSRAVEIKVVAPPTEELITGNSSTLKELQNDPFKKSRETLHKEAKNLHGMGILK